MCRRIRQDADLVCRPVWYGPILRGESGALAQTDLAAVQDREERMMKPSRYPVFRANAARASRLAAVGAAIFLSALVLGFPSANALPPANGSKCKSDWVN